MTIRDIFIKFGYDVDKASEKKANDSIQSLKSTANKVLGAIAVVFSIKGIASLAEAAADAEALKSQFTQVFGDMEAQANDSLNNIAANTGVAVNRMKGSFTQIGAFAKTTGMTTEESLAVADRAMNAVADSAAFYDRSMEQVTDTLQSFLKGNYANDAALGLSATETTRNTAANELYGKSFMQLSEAQKQLTLLKMVEDANKLSGAFGQASRESDTWTNQLGNLKQGVKDLSASAGAMFLKPAIQALKFAAMLVSKLTDGIRKLSAEGTFLNRVFTRISNGIQKANTSVARFIDRVGGMDRILKLLAIADGALLSVLAVKKIMTVVNTFRMMDKALLGAKLKMAAIVAVIVIIALLIEDLIGFMQGKDSFMGKMFEKFGIDGNKVRETIQSIIDAVKGLLPFLLNLGKSFGGMLVNALKQLLPLLMDLFKKLLPPIVSFIKRLVPMLMDIGRKIIPIILGVVERLIPFLFSIVERILPVIIGLVEKLLPFILQIAEKVLPVILGVIESLLPLLFSIIEAVLPVVLSLIEAILPLILQIVDMVLPLIISLIETLLPLVMQIIDAILPVIISLLETVVPILTQIVEAILPVILTLIEAILPLITTIIEAVLPVILELITAILPILTPIIELVANLVSALLPPIISLLEAIMPILSPILAVLKPIADVLGVIIGIVSKIVEWVAGGLSWIIGLFTGGGSDVTITTDSSGTPVQQNARGTNSSADTFIAGEEGPELVTGARGRKVFTHAQTGDVFQTLQDIARMAVTPKPETVAATTSSVENRSVVQNIEITNQFHGDRAGQKKSSEAMGKAADDATGMLARGLAYAR